MIRHIVWWTLKPEAEGHSAAENALTMKHIAEGLAGKIPSLKSIELSVELQPTTTVPAQAVLHTTHDDIEGLKAYAVHPEHLVLQAFIRKVSASRQAIDFTF